MNDKSVKSDYSRKGELRKEIDPQILPKKNLVNNDYGLHMSTEGFFLQQSQINQ